MGQYKRQAFIDIFREWAKQFYRILKTGGSGYVFTSDQYVSYLKDALEDKGLHFKVTIVWYETNPGENTGN